MRAFQTYKLPILLTACLIVSALMAGHGAPVSAAGAKDGEALAIEHCRRCHVIPGQNNFGIGSTPSFNIMVRSKAKDWRDKFEAFFSLPPHPNFVRIKEFRAAPKSPAVIAPIVLGLDDVDNLMAYVDSLAKELRKP